MVPAAQLGRWSKGFLVPKWKPGLGDTRILTGTIGAGIMTAGKMLLAAHPLAGAVTLAVGAMTELIGSLFQPDITKIQTTHIVDQIEAQALKPLRDAWERIPDDAKTPEAQQAALLIFDDAWAAVVKGCSNPTFGSAGQNCIADRQEGSCHWTVDGQTPGQPPNCGNWFIWYRDPIANDPAVAANMANPSNPYISGGSSGGTIPAGGGTGITLSENAKLYVGLGLVGVALLLLLSGGGD